MSVLDQIKKKKQQPVQKDGESTLPDERKSQFLKAVEAYNNRGKVDVEGNSHPSGLGPNDPVVGLGQASYDITKQVNDAREELKSGSTHATREGSHASPSDTELKG